MILGYTLQLYFDFSGYCDIAAGVARLFGLRLPMNFDSPYRSASVTEFWKRWHITLTTFLRECLYFPLGGSAGYGPDVLEHPHHLPGQRPLARGGLDVPGVGRPPRPGQILERAWGKRRDRLPLLLRWG